MREQASRLPELMETAGLTARERELIAMSDLADAEIASRFGITEGTVRVHKHNAIAKLRRAAEGS